MNKKIVNLESKNLYIAIGIKKKDNEVIVLAIDSENYKRICKESKERAKKYEIDEYKIFDFAKNGATECQLWMLEFGISYSESKDIIKSFLEELKTLQEEK